MMPIRNGVLLQRRLDLEHGRGDAALEELIALLDDNRQAEGLPTAFARISARLVVDHPPSFI